MASILDSLVAAANQGAKQITGSAGTSAEDILRSSQYGGLLDAVEKKAGDAVVAKVKDNAVPLLMLSIATGAVGGALLSKHWVGILAAAGIAGWAANKVINSK